MANDKKYDPTYLGKKSTDPVDAVDLIPWEGDSVTVKLECSEFTSVCPVTGQPDFGELEIEYRPLNAIIETKSLKLYLLKFREQGVFSEVLVNQIAEELWLQVKPEWICVRGYFNSRGGIAIDVEATRGDVG